MFRFALLITSCVFLVSKGQGQFYNWEQLNSPYGISIRTVEVTEKQEIYIANFNTNGVYHSIDNGDSWIFIPLSSGPSRLQHLYYSNGTQNNVMVGHNFTDRFATINGWEQTPAPPLISAFYPAGVYNVSYWIDFSSYIAATNTENIYYKSDASPLAQLVPSNPSITTNINDIYIIDSVAWLVNDAGQIYEFDAINGSQFNLNYAHSSALNAIYFLDPTLGYAVGDGGSILKTIDGGQNWLELESNTSLNLTCIDFRNSKKGIIGGETGGLISTLDGIHWANEFPPTDSSIYDIDFVNDSMIISVGYGGVIQRGVLNNLKDDHTIYNKKANSWYFGIGSGITFYTGDSVGVSPITPVNSVTAGSSICDTAGNVRYFTDGNAVWDGQSVLVPGATGLVGGSQCNNGFKTIMVDHPDLPHDVFMFYTARAHFAANNYEVYGFFHTHLNDTVNSGSPGILLVNDTLYEDPSLHLTAVNHANGRDVWVITHDFEKFEFRAYLINCTGLNRTPVISEVGATTDEFKGGFGELKASPRGDKLVMSWRSLNDCVVQLFDFNPETGIVSNAVILDDNDNYAPEPYSVDFHPAFSADGSKVFVKTFPYTIAVDDFVSYFDIDAGSPTQILSSKDSVSLEFGQSLGSGQLGPDGRIYWMSGLHPSRISEPNQPSFATNFKYQDFGPLAGDPHGNLPLFNQSIFYHSGIMNSEIVCGFQPIDFWLVRPDYPVMADSVKWTFGDTLSGLLNTSNTLNSSHLFEDQGFFNVTCTRYYNNGHSDLFSKRIYVPQVGFDLPDTVYMLNGTAILTSNIETPFPDVLWSTGDTTEMITVEEPGEYTLSYFDCYCGFYKDTVLVIDTVVHIDPQIVPIEIPNIFSPNGDGINDLYHLIKDPDYTENWTMIIMNRWGDYIVTLDPENLTWDGKNQKGMDCVDGVYFYQFNYLINGETYEREGSITLVR